MFDRPIVAVHGDHDVRSDGISRTVIQAPSTNLAPSTTTTVIAVAIAPRP